VILPKDNEKDLAEVPDNIRTEMTLHFVEEMDQVLKLALEAPLPEVGEEEPTALSVLSNTDQPSARQ
jgi:ATP-dependent Lon protease